MSSWVESRVRGSKRELAPNVVLDPCQQRCSQVGAEFVQGVPPIHHPFHVVQEGGARGRLEWVVVWWLMVGGVVILSNGFGFDHNLLCRFTKQGAELKESLMKKMNCAQFCKLRQFYSRDNSVS